MDLLTRHERNEDYGGLKAPFNASQKAALAQIQELLRQLSALDAQIASSYAALAASTRTWSHSAASRRGSPRAAWWTRSRSIGEWMSLRQMAKMCCGRQGNHFPIFLSQFVRPDIREIGTGRT